MRQYLRSGLARAELGRTYAAVFAAIGLVLVAAGGTPAARAANAPCDPGVPAITSGYGADGPYAMDQASIPNPVFRRQPVTVFFPRGAAGKRPVVFFSHGFGPGVWQAYQDLIRHVVSRGYTVVFSSYPVVGASIDGRYDDLWGGFQAAASKFADRLDLTRVAFVGHSFGGGATPAMARHGIVEQGWGTHGALLLALAPWYSYQTTDAQLRSLPASLVQAQEVYEQDDKNDWRMAIDQYDHAPANARYFFVVRSATLHGCTLTADHSTPGRNVSVVQKQYGVFRAFDALADYALGGNAAAGDSLAAMAHGSPGAAYDPLRLVTAPAPNPNGKYEFPWNSRQNPRMK